MKRYFPFSYRYDRDNFLASVDDYRKCYISCVDDMRENEPNVYKACQNYEENNVSFLSDFYNLVKNIDQLGERAAQDFGNVVAEYIFYQSAAVMAAENAPFCEETGLYEKSDLFYSATQKYVNAINRVKDLYAGRKYEQQADILIGTILRRYWEKLTEETTREHNEDAE